MIRAILSVVLSYTFLCAVIAQRDEISLNNGSFEEIPHKGGSSLVGIRGWYDCGELQFPSETAPDVHPLNAWKVTHEATEGRTYLGMVVRDNDSWESISQRLRQPLEEGKCYSFSIDLARSEYYISGSRVTQKEENYNEPAVLRIWGGTGVCGHHELLAESSIIKNTDWVTYEFEFQPSRDVNYFTLEAFYEVPVLIPYNGHLLLDNASKIVQIPCPGEDDFAVEEIAVAKPKEPIKKPAQTAPSKPAEETIAVAENPAPKREVVPAKKKILQELDAKTLRKGQTIRIEKLYFAANSDTIRDDSYEVLGEIYDFLKENRNIVVEIGGHTNTVPLKKQSMILSRSRARNVAQYLNKRGISSKRLRYRGYGKSQPIVKNDRYNMEARRKNQRVEIKILSLTYSEATG